MTRSPGGRHEELSATSATDTAGEQADEAVEETAEATESTESAEPTDDAESSELSGSPTVSTSRKSPKKPKPAEPAESSEPAESPAELAARRRRRLITVLAVLTVLSLAAAIGTGIYWYQGTASATAQADATRDEAVDAAQQIVVNINTVRPATLDADLDAAQSSMTEPMLTQYQQVRQRFADNLRQAQAEVVPTPVSASLTAFDPDRGTASAIVAINVDARSATSAPVTKQLLFLVEMIRTPDGWKAAKATPSTGQGE